MIRHDWRESIIYPSGLGCADGDLPSAIGGRHGFKAYKIADTKQECMATQVLLHELFVHIRALLQTNDELMNSART